MAVQFELERRDPVAYRRHLAYQFGVYQLQRTTTSDNNPLSQLIFALIYLVDSDDVEGMDSHTEMERILADGLDEVLVGADSGSFHSFGRKLFQFVGDHDDVSWEEEDGGLLRSKIVDSDLGVWDTSTESRLKIVVDFKEWKIRVCLARFQLLFYLGVRLVLAIPIASGWAATHGC